MIFNNYLKYIRQLILSDIGFLNQDLFFKSRVLCVGAGGLGSPALLYLSAAGIGNIGIIDYDIVSITNLNRQVIYNYNDIGKNKAVRAKNFILKSDNNINIKAYDLRLTLLNSHSIFKNYDIILDCTDNIASKFLINDTAMNLNKILISSSVLGFEGYTFIFSKSGICYRCLYKSFSNLNCVNHGIIGAVTGVIGSFQALLTLSIILKNLKFFKHFYHFDLKNFNFFSHKTNTFEKCHL